MITPQFSLDLHAELIVDNFAGGGGVSTGIELALGRHVDHAINHDRHALGMHRINHPQTVHHCEDVFDIDPETMCEGRPIGLAHFSPDCTDFSKAKGGKPLDKKIRGLVLVMLRYAKYGARVMTMENVEEITGWGPLIKRKKNGKWEWYRDPAHMGRTWKAFLACLSTGIAPNHPDLPEILERLAGTVTREELVRGFGYIFEARQIRACDVGAPTIRKRLYMVARRDGRPIIWPEANYFDPNLKAASRRHYRPYRAIAECIDWTRPCPSIFLTREEAKARKIRCKRPLKTATLRRIAMGIDRYVIRSKKPFLVNLTHQGGDRIESVERPANTVTGARRGEKALVVSRFNGDHSGRTDGATRNYSPVQPLGVQDTSNRYGVVEADLAAPFITEHANASSQRNMPANEPARTICGEVKGGHLAGVAAHLMVNTTGHPGAPVDEPGRTQTTGQQQSVIACTGIQSGYGEADGQAPRVLDIQQPSTTIVSSVKQAAVAATLIHTAHGEADASGKRRGRGAHDIEESMPSVLSSPDGAIAMLQLRGDVMPDPGNQPQKPALTVTADGQHLGVISANIVRQFGESIGQSADSPAPTTVAGGGGKTGLVATYLAQHNAGGATNPGHSAEDPSSTISTTGSQQQVVAASIASYFGSARDGQGVEEAARTISTKPHKALVESSAVCSMTPEQIESAHRVVEFLRFYGVEIEGEFAMVAGFIIVDIGMRMLTPRELFRAQGFGENYIIDRAWVIDPENDSLTEIFLTKEQQIRMCGNSVCPQVMAALVRANVPELAVYSPRAHQRAILESEVRA